MNKLIAFLLVYAPIFVYAQSQWGTYQIKDELTGKSTQVTAFKSKLGFTKHPESKIQVKVECQLDGDYIDGIIYTLTTFNAPQLPKVKDGENIFFRSVLQSNEETPFGWLGTEYKNQLMSYTAFYTSEALALNSLLTKGQIVKDLKVNSFADIRKILPKKIEILFADGNKFIVDFSSKEYIELVSKCYADYKKSDKFLKRKQKEAKIDKEQILEDEQKKISMQQERESQNVVYKENRQILNNEIKAKLKDSMWNIALTIEVMTHYDDRVFENIKKHEKIITAELNLILERFSEKQFKDSTFSQNIEGLFKDELNTLLEEYEDFGGIEKVKIIKTKEFYQ